ncbi:hypothetical protein VTL71DRAFT_1655 [Oculimacula yallundae]|uniref:NAD-dependent epimerase/dehydratase domain-containing protein n=1 Tax=Oculimacula yallundae TaxID=86028 RepID=A0ABR4CD85_9HELO
MVNVLVIGAGLPMGKALAFSLTRSGDHRVYAFVSTVAAAIDCERIEITPILCNSRGDFLAQALCLYAINVVVDVRHNDEEAYNLLELLKAHRAGRLAERATSGHRIPKLGFIFVGSTLVHGSSTLALNDLAPTGTFISPSPPTPSLSERPTLEKTVLDSSDALDVMIIRPALVYGRSSPVWSHFFQAIHDAASRNMAQVQIPAFPTSRLALIHEDDAVTGIHAAIDKLPLISGTGVYPVFDLVTSQEGISEILYAAAAILGFRGHMEMSGCGEDPIAWSLCCSGNLSSGRAKQLLGWEPKRAGFVQAMDLYVKAWLACQGTNELMKGIPDIPQPVLVPNVFNPPNFPGDPHPPMVLEGHQIPRIP